jgi:hypothetical protein
MKAVLKEGLLSKLVNPGHGELDKYLTKVDDLLTETIEGCDELIKEGEEIMEEDILRLPQVGERNRLILQITMNSSSRNRAASAISRSPSP